MNVLKYIIHFVGVYLLMISVVCSQTATDDLITMSKKTSSIIAYDITIDVKVYKNNNTAKPVFVSSGRTIKSGNQYFLYMLNKKTIVSEDLMLVVDDKQKLLLYTKISKEQLKAMTVVKTINIDSIIKSTKTNIKYLGKNKTETKIQILNKDEDIESIVISLNPKSHIIKSITYNYSIEGTKNTGNSKVVVTYVSFLLAPKNPELFNQKIYIKKEGNQILATTAYKSYKLINAETYTNQ